MIVDYRVYCTIYIVGVLGYFGSCCFGLATIGNSVAQRRCETVWAISCAALVLTGVVQSLDWLWS